MFFPDGRDSILDVSSTSPFRYARELAGLLPEESEKQFLMMDEVMTAFDRLALSYIRRTTTLQRFCNAFFRSQLVKYFRIQQHMLPPWLESAAAADRLVLGAAADTVAALTQSEDETPSPSEDLLLRTKSTTPESFLPPPVDDLMQWDDMTHQLVRFLLHRVFHPSDGARLQQGHRVCITGMSTAFLNGAEGYFVGRPEPGRVEVELVFPASVVQKVRADKNTTTIKIPEDKAVRYPDDSDVVSLARLQRAAAAGCSSSGAWLEKFSQFLFTLATYKCLKSRGSDPLTVDITLSDCLSRFKHASCTMCSIASDEPMAAYMKRKLRHARNKLHPASAQPAAGAKDALRRGGEYYAMLSDGRGSGRYYLLKLLDYRVYGSKYQARVEFAKVDGSKMETIISFPHFDAFIPKAEFDLQLSHLATSEPDGSFADNRDNYKSEAYNEHSGEILSCLAASFPDFKLLGRVPSRAIEAPYTVRNASDGKCLEFTEVDLGMSFKPFFSEDFMPHCDGHQRARLMRCAAMEELNRCFFVHLGLALDLHPFALQVRSRLSRCVVFFLLLFCLPL